MPEAPAPKVLVFDVNETLIDLEHLTPLFVRVFGDAAVMREWFAQMILYSQTITLSGAYVPLGALGVGTLRMLGRGRGIDVTGNDVDELKARTISMPAHADVAPALDRLKAAGFRLATLTNSPPAPDGGPLRKAGLEDYFEQRHSVDAIGKFKTAPETYRHVAEHLGIKLSEICLVACHAWDCFGVQLLGGAGALVMRKGNAAMLVDGLPVPTLVAKDMVALADAMIRKWR